MSRDKEQASRTIFRYVFSDNFWKLKMTSIPNGICFMFDEPLADGKYSPRINHCVGVKCKVFHYDQPDKQKT